MIDDQDIEFYFRKSGDERIYPDNLIENEHGFASFRIHDNKLVILNTYGDGPYWDRFFMELAKRLELDAVMFGTRRNPKAFERKFGYKLTGYILEKEVNYG